MTTFRIHKRQRFTTIAQETINDSSLSFRARGVLAWLLDKPDDWRCTSEEIARAGQEGRDAVRTALSELEGRGYLKRTRTQDAHGHWVTVTNVFESTDAGFPGVGYPDVGSPVVGEPGPLTKTKTKDEDQPLKPPRLEVVDSRFDAFWEQYPRKVDKAKSKKIFDRLMKTVDHEDILIGLDPWLDYWEQRGDPSFIPYPTTWLNNERWTASPPEVKPNLSRGTAALLEIVKNRSAQ